MLRGQISCCVLSTIKKNKEGLLWLRICPSTVGGMDLIPDHGRKSCMLHGAAKNKSINK